MDWDALYVISRSLTLEVSRLGKLVGATSLSRRPSELDADALPALLRFAAGDTPRAVFASLSQEWEIEEAGFGEFVESMIEKGFLLPAGAAREADPGGLPSEMFGSVVAHLSMLQDAVRVMSYRTAIERHAPGRTVVEIGCGTGVLSLFAARAGARKVIAIEETRIAEVAAAMIAANGCSGIVDLRVANSRDVEIAEPADLIIHEILGVDAFDENILPVILDARRRFLRPGGRLLPQRLEICCLGVEIEEPPEPAKALRLARARELSGLYGLDFGPFVRALEAFPFQPSPARMVTSGNRPGFDRKILSEEVRLLDLDLQGGALEIVGQPTLASLHISAAGRLGGVVLFFRAHLDEELRMTNSPLAPPTTWGWDVRSFSQGVPVVPGDEVRLSLEIESTLGRQGMLVELA